MPEPPVALPAQTTGEAVADDYRATGLTLGRHPLALLRPHLDALGCGDTRQLHARRAGTRLRLPGLVLIRQRPGSAKGVVFLTVEDEHGVANLVVFAGIAARDRAALVSGRLLLAEGRVEREVAQAAVPITHLIVDRLIDRSDLLSQMAEIDGGTQDRDWAEQALGRADEVRRSGPDSQRPPKVTLPGSRDFR